MSGAAEVAKNPALLREQMLADLNKLRVSHIIHFAQEAGFLVRESEYDIDDDDRKYLTQDIRTELAGYSEDELLAHTHILTLQKP